MFHTPEEVLSNLRAFHIADARLTEAELRSVAGRALIGSAEVLAGQFFLSPRRIQQMLQRATDRVLPACSAPLDGMTIMFWLGLHTVCCAHEIVRVVPSPVDSTDARFPE
ncbi:MAG: hypothetical protein M0R74_02450 [Dehalococcoidia bacterium]|nr:hypothetical protein [Dehalococcoidia bacterium]